MAIPDEPDHAVPGDPGQAGGPGAPDTPDGPDDPGRAGGPGAPGGSDGPDGSDGTPAHRWVWRVLRDSVVGFFNDGCTDWAAALTYYGLLALFPAAIVVVALAGLVATTPSTVNALVSVVRDLAPPSIVDPIADTVRAVLTRHGPAGVLLSFGIIGALWSSSGWVGVFARAANTIYGVRETRPFQRRRPQQVVIAAVYLLVMALSSAAATFSGRVVAVMAQYLPLGSALTRAWQVLKWPVLVLLIGVLLAALYRVTPDIRPQKLRWLALGGLVAWVVWLLFSITFGLYVGSFGRYGVTYGSLGAMIIFLIWLYLSNCAILFGAEINAHIAQARGRLEVEHTEHPDPTADVIRGGASRPDRA